MKQHLVGGYRNATACRKCLDHVKEEINNYMSKKKEIKEQRNLIVDIDAEDYGIEDKDEDEVSVSNLNKRAAPSGVQVQRSQDKRVQWIHILH